MSKRNDVLLLEDILEASKRILNYVEGLSKEKFFDDFKTQDAVVRNFEIIGEAAARLSESFKTNRVDIPWHQLKGYRNRLIHEYFGVDYSIVWDIIKNDLPKLIEQLEN